MATDALQTADCDKCVAMLLDCMLLTPDPTRSGAYARAVEEAGFAGLWISETSSDPFISLALAAAQTERLTLGTGIAVAFPRTPTILATLAWDLARLSHGRFALGLGSQVRAHNELRLGVKWEKPVRKLRETVEAIQAVWRCWQEGVPLDYEGEFFRLKLMTPFFTPPPLTVARPPIFLAAVNEQMLRLVGTHADGVFLHALHTPRYLTEYALPHIADGLARSGRTRADVRVATGVFVVPTDDAERPAAAFEQYAKQQISFYLSTPAYRIVAELHGWEETAQQLGRLARQGEWAAMPALIDDAMLAELAVSGPWGQLPALLRARYGDHLDRVSYYLPFEPGKHTAGWQATLAAFRA